MWNNKLASCLIMIFGFSTSVYATAPTNGQSTVQSLSINASQPTLILSEDDVEPGSIWYLEDYDHNLLSLKDYKHTPDGKVYWTFQVAPKAFVGPHVLKIKLVTGDPEDLEDYEEHIYHVVTVPKA
jgi:hypothetical protein